MLCGKTFLTIPEREKSDTRPKLCTLDHPTSPLTFRNVRVMWHQIISGVFSLHKIQCIA